jgi:hypothetical protein
MKTLLSLVTVLVVMPLLTGCLAANQTPIGVQCDYTQGKPMWELPLVCQGGR